MTSEKDMERHKESAKMPNDMIKVYWLIETMKEGDFHEDDFGHEYQSSPTWTRRIDVQMIRPEEAEDIFEKEDGDYDFSATILFITDMKGKMLWKSKHKPAMLYETSSFDKFRKAKNLTDKFYHAEAMVKQLEEMNRLKGKDWDRRINDFKEEMRYRAKKQKNAEEIAKKQADKEKRIAWLKENKCSEEGCYRYCAKGYTLCEGHLHGFPRMMSDEDIRLLKGE